MRGVCDGRGTGRRTVVTVSILVVMVLAGACERADRVPTGLDADSPAVVAESAGGSRADQGGQDAGRGEFFPLEIGNEWRYSRSLLLTREMFASGMTESTEVNILRVHRLVGTETLGGREYVVERRQEFDSPSPGGGVITSWIRYRQDRAGLYEADVPSTQPPAAQEDPAPESVALARVRDSNPGRVELWRRISAGVEAENRAALERAWSELTKKLDALADLREPTSGRSLAHGGPPGGVMPGEITRLAYPLRPGQEWTIRPEPFFGSEVEAREVLDLPPGKMSCARINVTNFALEPDDEVFIWYGRDGFLRMTVHVETEMVDINGNVIGLLTFDENTALEHINLVRPGRF